jgi:hypothetical protein
MGLFHRGKHDFIAGSLTLQLVGEIGRDRLRHGSAAKLQKVVGVA